MSPVPALSVIVANRDYGRYLPDCLESILGQSFRDLEVLVADDGSSDDSPAVIRRYADRHPAVIRPIFGPGGLGPGQARHRALLQARGDWYTTLDSDDGYADPHKLEREMELARRHQAAGETVVAFSDIALVREDRSLIALNSQWAPVREGFILEGILGRTCLIPRDFVTTRAAYFAAGGFDGSLPVYEDWDLKIRLAERHRFVFSGLVGTAYRRHGRGLSSLPGEENIAWAQRVFDRHINRLEPPRRETARNAFARFVAGVRRAGPASGPSRPSVTSGEPD